MLTDMLTTMANGFVVSVTQDFVEVSCPCPARSRVQQLCTVRYKATMDSVSLNIFGNFFAKTSFIAVSG